MEEELVNFNKKEAEYQGKMEAEAAGYGSPTWRVQRALRGLLNVADLQGESAVTAHLFFSGTGRGASQFRGLTGRPTIIFWGSPREE